jgi:hypothetical protein
MDEVIYGASGPLSNVASMDEVIYSAPWALASMAEISHSSSGPPAKGWNTSPSQIGTPIYLLHCCFRCIVAFQPAY